MNPQVDDYIKGLKQDWQRQVVIKLRNLVHEAEPKIVEKIKWGTPAFEHRGVVCWTFCAKQWVHFSFPQGALLDDSHGLFEPTTNKAMRTIKLYKDSKIPSKIIVQLVRQAVVNNNKGKKLKFTAAPKQKITLPNDMQQALKAHGLIDKYNDRPYYQRKGYVQWVDAAKREVTRTKRIAKIIEELEEGSYMPSANTSNSSKK